MSKYGGVPVEGSRFGGVPVERRKKADVNPVAGTVRAGLQGMTFGASDEIGSAVAALAGSIKTGESFGSVYDKMHQGTQDKREQFRDDQPALAMGAEMLGGVATGAMGGAKALGSQAFRQAGNAGKFGRIAGVGAAEGSLYGAGAADQGERVEGAATGAVMGAALSPLVAGGANALGKLGAGVANYSNKKLGEGAKSQAVRAIRDAADSEGIDGAQAWRQMRELGPEGTITDLGDSFRSLARAGMDTVGPMKTAARKMVNERQKGMQDRLMESVEKSTGKSAGAFRQTLKQRIKQRSDEAGPMFDDAYSKGVEETVGLKVLVNNPLMKSAMRKGKVYAEAEGKGVDNLRVLHYAKMDLDDQIGKAMRAGEKNKARLLLSRKRELLDEVGAQNPEYVAALDNFAGHSAIANALESGSKLLKTSPDDLAEITQNMTKSELEAFKMGGIKSVGDMLDGTNQNADAVRKLLGTRKIQEQLGFVIDDPADFLKRAAAESEMSTTRGMIVGGPNTAERLAAQKALSTSIDPGVGMSIASGDPAAITSTIIRTFSESKPSREMIQNLGDLMLKKGLTRKEVLRIFDGPKIRQALGADYDLIVAPYVRAGAAPAAIGYGEQ